MPVRYKTARCVLAREGSFLLAVHSRFRYRRVHKWGLLGGGLDWGEAPEKAARREIREELNIDLERVVEVGPYNYKRAAHMVYAAHVDVVEFDYDDFELVDLRWFSLAEIEGLQRNSLLHTGYELDAVQAARVALNNKAA